MYELLKTLTNLWELNRFQNTGNYPTEAELRKTYGDDLVSELLHHGYIQPCLGREICITILGVQQYHQMKSNKLLTFVAVMSMVAAFYPILKDFVLWLLALL